MRATMPAARKPAAKRSRAPAKGVQIKRAYDPPSDDDGYRVLIDRVWPRGVARERARLDEWARDLAPSAELRRWFGHDPGRFEEFRERYRAELKHHADAVAGLRRRARSQRVTIVFGARDAEHSNAAVLAELLGKG
jgi:uncharacterized protein YeaO (DUF488 family)